MKYSEIISVAMLNIILGKYFTLEIIFVIKVATLILKMCQWISSLPSFLLERKFLLPLLNTAKEETLQTLSVTS